MVQFINWPLSERAESEVRYLRERVAEIEQSARRSAEPYLARLAHLEGYRLPPMMILSPDEASHFTGNLPKMEDDA